MVQLANGTVGNCRYVKLACLHMGLSIQLPCKLFLLSEKQWLGFFSFYFSYKDITHLALFSKLAKDIFALKLTSGV